MAIMSPSTGNVRLIYTQQGLEFHTRLTHFEIEPYTTQFTQLSWNKIMAKEVLINNSYLFQHKAWNLFTFLMKVEYVKKSDWY